MIVQFFLMDADGNNAATSEYSQSKARMKEWAHIAVRVEGFVGGTISIFVNALEGDNEADNPGDWTASAASMYYGVNAPANNSFFNGYINNVAIWNDNFGGSTITEIYNQGEPKNELESYPNMYFYHVSNEKSTDKVYIEMSKQSVRYNTNKYFFQRKKGIIKFRGKAPKEIEGYKKYNHNEILKKVQSSWGQWKLN